MSDNIWIYEIYGLTVVSNTRMPLLEETNNIVDTIFPRLMLTVSFEDVNNSGISAVKIADDVYVLKINNLAQYTIDGGNNSIKCLATDFESFFSTFFNLPFSIYLAMKNTCLFHTCTLCHNNSLVCLCGDKGIGKTTLSYLLQDDSFFFFSDDTLSINLDGTIKRANNLAKMTDKTVDELNVMTQSNCLNVSGKHYVYLKEHNIVPTTIAKIFFVRRNADDVICLKQITQQVLKKAVIFHNIVGINYLPFDLIKRINIDLIFENTPIYYLFIPNDLTRVCAEKETIKKAISG